MKKIKAKRILIFNIALFALLLPSCSGNNLTIYVYKQFNSLLNTQTRTDYVTNTNDAGLKWITQREISIRFRLSVKDDTNDLYEFGTAWILSKKTNSDFTYYLATNIHVIQYLNTLTTNTTIKTINSSNQIVTNSKYEVIECAFAFIDNDLTSSFWLDDNDNLQYLWTTSDTLNPVNYYIKLDTLPNLVYTATGSDFVNDTTNYVDVNSNQTILNPAIDFAVIEIDFSNVLDKVNQDNVSVSDYLYEYDNNPTKFSSQVDFEADNSYYLGGFVQGKTDWKPNNNVTWIGLTNVNLNNNNNFFATSYDNSVNGVYFSDPNGVTPYVGSIMYVKQENQGTYYWYRDVANQIIINDASLGNGASGSMLVKEEANGDFSVAAIYWGSYSYTNRKGLSYEFGACDLLISNSYSYQIKNKGIEYNYIYNSYNVLEMLNNNINDLTITYV